MANTDRQRIKDQQEGVYLTTGGMANAKQVVGEMHEETFIFGVDADAAVAERGIHIKKAARLKSVVEVPVTALAVDPANYVTKTVSKRDGAGGAAVVMATHTTNSVGGSALAAWVPRAFTLSTVAGAIDLPAGSVLTFQSAETGTPTTPLARVTVTIEYV